MKKIHQIMSAALSVFVSLSLLAGCGGKSGSTDKSGASGEGQVQEEQGKDGEPVEVSIAIWGAGVGLSDQEDPIYKEIVKQTGVKLIPKNVTWDDFEQKIQLWSTNGQLPDIFVGDFVSKSFFDKWINQNVIRALPDDLSAYPSLAEHLKSDRAQSALRDGKYYMIPRTTYPDITYSVLDRNIVYRWDLAQKAGVTKEPETYEEFTDMIKKIIAADPEGQSISGMNQLQPTLVAGVVYPYAGILHNKWVAKDGKFMPMYFADRDKLVQAMQFGRDCYTSGVFEKDMANAKMDTTKANYVAGKNAAMLFTWSGPAGLYRNIVKDYEAVHGEGSFLKDNKIAHLFPSPDGNTYYYVDTEAWSESYISAKVDDKKLAAICKLFDYLYSEDGKRLMFCGLEGEDYKVEGDKIVMLDNSNLGEKYQVFKEGSNVAALAMWNWYDDKKPTTTPQEYRDLSKARHEEALEKGTIPKYYDSVMLLSTPLKEKFIFEPENDLLKVMAGSEPVDKMVDDLLANYESKGLSEMLDEVNAKAAELGIKP